MTQLIWYTQDEIYLYVLWPCHFYFMFELQHKIITFLILHSENNVWKKDNWYRAQRVEFPTFDQTKASMVRPAEHTSSLWKNERRHDSE